MDTSSLFTTQTNHTLPSVAWGNNTHWYIDMQNTAISKRQGWCVLNPLIKHRMIWRWDQIPAPDIWSFQNLLSNYLSTSMVFRKSKSSVCNTTAKHTAMPIGETRASFLNGTPKKDWHIQSCILWYSEAILCKVKCAVCIPEFASPENAGVSSTMWPEWSD